MLRPRGGSASRCPFAERGVLVCTPHRQPYFYVFERGEEIPSYVNQDYQKQRTVVALFEQYYEKNFELLVDELLRAARDRTETTARLAVSVLGLDEATCSGAPVCLCPTPMARLASRVQRPAKPPSALHVP